MPIYEYEALDQKRACKQCANRFEIIQGIDDAPLLVCPRCGHKIRKIISWSHASVVETSEEHARIESSIGRYEKAGMWSHAAELADKYSENTKDTSTKIRALENYKKAGYDVKTLEKHLKEDKT